MVEKIINDIFLEGKKRKEKEGKEEKKKRRKKEGDRENITGGNSMLTKVLSHIQTKVNTGITGKY